jgi:hypothetical protein
MSYQYSFKDVLGRSERITWRVEDLIGGDKTLDFSKPFMPETLARVETLKFLSAPEKRILSQVRGHTYLTMFGIIEEMIVPFVLDHARPFINGEDYRARAFLEFISEEAKHIHLFRRFQEEFRKGFATECKVIGPAADIAKHILSHHPLSVALTILMIEWTTQRHFQESMHDDGALDPQFKSLLKHHWMEEMQHAQLDTLMVEAIAANMKPSEIDSAIDGVLAIGGFLDEGLRQQTGFDLEALEVASGRKLSIVEREEFMAKQHQANRWTYIGSGLTHKNFLETLGQLSPAKRKAFGEVAPNFC